MSSICLIDTSIFVEILDVPKYNQHRASVLKDYETYVKPTFRTLNCHISKKPSE